MRLLAAVVTAVAVASATPLAQTATTVPPAQAEAPDDTGWAFFASAYTYFVPNGGNYVQPTVTADRGWLHLEARYNYEELGTGSAWAGYNVSGGETLAWEITPMIGGVFGDVSGVAPGYKGSLSWWKLALYSEGEHFFDASDVSGNFSYNWLELTLAPVDRFRFGFVTQRTRVYETDREIQRGGLLGVNVGKLDVSAYFFNPDDDAPTFVFAVSLGL